MTKGPKENTTPRLHHGVIFAFLLAQLCIPLTYYTMRENPYDERFAWRMFSAIRLYQCNVELQEGPTDAARPVRLGRVVHQAWINHLRRNREEVAEALLLRRCAEPAVDEATILTTCRSSTGEPLPLTRYHRDCDTEEFSIERGNP